ncbi:methyl-accepting chemotaxis protein [Alcaligenes sp. SDU_A2]|uniref:methyl-accepting chemotaxis protein n=1 Tax=Alcaligenes sp. SDU_A2 TaxID=3136634 RepID=UPI00311DDEDC
MRKNLPVTDTETNLLDDQYLISKTDLKGRIVYANPAFIEVSGFSREELMGQAHNIVRHPDMPPEVFADLWHTLQHGRSWTGMVKNRRKDGGFYWVLANASPILENGELTGFASVRVRAEPMQIQEAEQFYQELRQGRARTRRICEGRIVARGWRRPWAAIHTLVGPSLLAAFLRKGLLNIGVTALLAALILNMKLSTQDTTTLIAALSTGAGLMLIYQAVLMRRVLGSLRIATHIAQQISAGNLTVDTRTAAVQKLEKLGLSLDLMRKSLMSISTDVHRSTHDSQAVAMELSESSALLETRTHEQAASMQETTASMNSFSQTVLQTAQNARTSHELSTRSAEIAARGNQAVQQVTASMQRILDSSRDIGNIVSMIDSIAFQTNILSINASIESARAGEAGKGFAVVASAVRSLAQQAAAAADNIKQLIQDTTALSAQGAAHAEHAGQTMNDILQSVSEVSGLMGEISAATTEQSTGLSQLTQALGQVDQITTRNAALVHDLGATTRRLNENGNRLQEAISVLNHDSDAHQDTRPLRPTPPAVEAQPRAALPGPLRLNTYKPRL